MATNAQLTGGIHLVSNSDVAKACVVKESGEAIVTVLKLTSTTTDAFPPLKSAAGGALHIAELVVVHMNICDPSVMLMYSMCSNSSQIRKNGPVLPNTSRIHSHASFDSFLM